MVKAATASGETNGRLLELSQRDHSQEASGVYSNQNTAASPTAAEREDAVPAESIITQVDFALADPVNYTFLAAPLLVESLS